MVAEDKIVINVGHTSEIDTLLPSDEVSSSSSDVFSKLLFSVFFFATGASITFPVRPRLILDASGGDLSKASLYTGTVSSLQSLISIFLLPLLGTLCDTLGRKPILFLSQFGELLALFIIATFPKNLVVQFPAYLLISLTEAYFTTVHTIIADISPTTTISTQNYGILGALFGVCFAISPPIGGFIESHFYLASSFHAACLIILVSIGTSLFVPETQSVLSNSPSFSLPAMNPIPRARVFLRENPSIIHLAFALAMHSFCETSLISILLLFATATLNWDTSQVGLYFSAIGVSIILSQGVFSHILVRMVGEKNTIMFGYTMATLHYLLFAVATSSWVIYANIIPGMLGFAADPAVKAVIARQVSKEEQGTFQGSLTSFCSVLKPVAPLLAGGLLSFGGSIGFAGLPFVVIGMISSISIVLINIALNKAELK